jgi:hypothetical protein
MQQAFRATGGLLSMDEVQAVLNQHGGPSAETLIRWIREGLAIAFEWRDETWLPMFQFSRKALTVHPALIPVMRELSTIYDGWETANWFSLPNTLLANRFPVEMLARDLSAVWYAARVDRFIATGEASFDKQPLVEHSNNAPAGRLRAAHRPPQLQSRPLAWMRKAMVPGSHTMGQHTFRPAV